MGRSRRSSSLRRTGTMTLLTLDSLTKMLFGELSVKNLSGPITIAKVAGASAQSGVGDFLNFLAYLSISLGVLNLLPIPVLDGGHLLFTPSNGFAADRCPKECRDGVFRSASVWSSG